MSSEMNAKHSTQLRNYYCSIIFSLTSMFFCSSASAQDLMSTPIPPRVPHADEFGVNLLTATWTYHQPQQLHTDIDRDMDFSLFTGNSRRSWGSSLQAYLVGNIYSDDPTYTVVIGGSSYTFRYFPNQTAWQDKNGMGNRLTFDNISSLFTFYRRDGVKYIFDQSIYQTQPQGANAF